MQKIISSLDLPKKDCESGYNSRHQETALTHLYWRNWVVQGWNLEQLRYCQCYRKISLLPAFKPTTQKKFEIHNLNSGSLHNGNNVLPFGSPQSTPYFKKIDIVSHRLAERLHNLGEKDHPQIPIMLLFTEGTSVNSICKSQLVPKSVNLAVTTFRSTYLTWLCRLS